MWWHAKPLPHTKIESNWIERSKEGDEKKNQQTTQPNELRPICLSTRAFDGFMFTDGHDSVIWFARFSI